MIRSMIPQKNRNASDPIRISSAQEITRSYHPYLMDESRFGPGWADEIFFPTTEAQICQILKEMASSHTSVTISGARTGITSAAMPNGGILINMEKMNHILALIHDSNNRWSVWLEPGVRLSDFHNWVETKQLPLPAQRMAPFLSDPQIYFYPPDPTEETALIGSTVATNASGARSLYYGATRSFVLGLRVALTNGEILEIERGKHRPSLDGRFHITDTHSHKIAFSPPEYRTPSGKSTCGYFSEPDMDLIDLFIGSEGTLGVITAVRLKLEKKPEAILSALSFFPEEEKAVSFVKDVRAKLIPLCLEYFDSHSLNLIRSHSQEVHFNLPGKANVAIFWETPYKKEKLEELYENWEVFLSNHGSSMDETWAGMERGEWLKLKEFRHCIPELINRIIGHRKAKNQKIHKISTDMAVPDHHLSHIMEVYRATLKQAGLEYVIFGHIGDNHLHINILPQSESDMDKAKEVVMSLAQKVVALKGVVATEHGIGKLKHDLLRIQYGDKGLEEMARVKKALDPNTILGVGNIFPEAFLRRDL